MCLQNEESEGHTSNKKPRSHYEWPHISYTEPVFLNVYGAQESIPRNEFRQPCSLAGRYANPVHPRFHRLFTHSSSVLWINLYISTDGAVCKGAATSVEHAVGSRWVPDPSSILAWHKFRRSDYHAGMKGCTHIPNGVSPVTRSGSPFIALDMLVSTEFDSSP